MVGLPPPLGTGGLLHPEAIGRAASEQLPAAVQRPGPRSALHGLVLGHGTAESSQPLPPLEGGEGRTGKVGPGRGTYQDQSCYHGGQTVRHIDRQWCRTPLRHQHDRPPRFDGMPNDPPERTCVPVQYRLGGSLEGIGSQTARIRCPKVRAGIVRGAAVLEASPWQVRSQKLLRTVVVVDELLPVPGGLAQSNGMDEN